MKRLVLFCSALFITVVNVFSLFSSGMSIFMWLLQLLCDLVLMGLIVNDFQNKCLIKASTKIPVLVVGAFLLAGLPIAVSPRAPSFSLSDYTAIIKDTKQNAKEHEIITSLPRLTEREKNGEIDERKALEAFNLLYPNSKNVVC